MFCQKVRNRPLWCQVTTQHCMLRPLQQIEPQAFDCFTQCLSFLGQVLSSQAQGCSEYLVYRAKRFSSLPRSSTFTSKAGPPGSFSKFKVLGIRRPVVYYSVKWHPLPPPPSHPLLCYYPHFTQDEASLGKLND